MRTHIAFATPDAHARRPHKRVNALVFAAICPPALAVLPGLLFANWIDIEAGDGSRASISQLLMPLMLGGTIILSAGITLECWVDANLGSMASEFRTVLGISTLVTLTLLAMSVTAQAERHRVSYAAEFVVFLCLPFLLVCAPLLWSSAKNIKNTRLRSLMLTLFTGATALIEWQCRIEDFRNAEEKLFTLHSLLIALALAIWLGAWGNTQFRQR
jgi:hypothetical protein